MFKHRYLISNNLLYVYEVLFIFHADTLLNKAKVNVFVYEQITEYLINRFRKNGFIKALENDKTLILFYASWCPHFQRLIPKLIKLYNDKKEKKLEVYAVSIDTNKTDWIDFINRNDLKWINVRAINEEYSKIVREYHLYSTPTMIVIDKNKKVISIPNDISELNDMF